MGKDYCAISLCHNFTGKIGRFGKVVKLHSLPKEPYLRSAWVRAISRKNYTPNRNTFVCSDHFPDGEGQTLKYTVPTLHLPQKDHIVLRERTTKNSNKPPATENLDENDNGVSCLPDHTDAWTVDFSYVPFPTEEEERRQSAENEAATQTHFTTETSSTQTDVQPEITISSIAEKDVPFYTGLSDKSTFYALLETCISHGVQDFLGEKSSSMSKLSLQDGLFLTLMRLRLGLLLRDIADRFHVSESTVSREFNYWIVYLYSALQSIVFIPEGKAVDEHIPGCFEKFPDTKNILDCTEIFVETPSSLDNKSRVYSSYKSHSTFKALIGINKTGAVTLLSKLFGCSVSDVEITRRSGLYDKLQAGDAVMTDKGFIRIKPDLEKLGVKLYAPPMNTKGQLSKEEVTLTRRIASARIHLERKMEQIKNFRILHGVIPLSLNNSINEIFFVCTALTNPLPPLFK